jgi:hypothetical protein
MGKSVVIIGAPMPRRDAASFNVWSSPIARQEHNHG